MMYGYSTGWWGGIMMLWWLALLVALILFIIWLSKQLTEKSSLDIAKQRYAKGEITKKEFEEIQKTIGR